MKKGSAKAVPAGKRTAAEKLQYVKKNWQLYVFFLLPASAACTSSDDHLQIRAHGWRTDRF